MTLSKDQLSKMANVLLVEDSEENRNLKEAAESNVLQPLRDTLEVWLNKEPKMPKAELIDNIVNEFLIRVS